MEDQQEVNLAKLVLVANLRHWHGQESAGGIHIND
jgi:hypothetical protein